MTKNEKSEAKERQHYYVYHVYAKVGNRLILRDTCDSIRSAMRPALLVQSSLQQHLILTEKKYI